MRNVKIKIEQAVKNGVSTLNATEFEVADEKQINKDRLVEAFASAVCRRFQSKQIAKDNGYGGSIKFSANGVLNMVVQIDNKEAINLSQYQSETGINIKFPAHAAKKYGMRKAKDILMSVIFTVVDDAEMFNEDLKGIFE